MKSFVECWISAASELFSQALLGEPALVPNSRNTPLEQCFALTAEIFGGVSGRFTLILEEEILRAPLLGDGAEQIPAWVELAKEVAESAAGELLAASGLRCRIDAVSQGTVPRNISRSFLLKSAENAWGIAICDELTPPAQTAHSEEGIERMSPGTAPSAELLLDIELEAALRFGCCEMPLGQILELGPGDVVELDRHVSDPVDLIVGDKIVARGEVVLLNGNFGLRVTDVAAPQKRLETIRCLF